MAQFIFPRPLWDRFEPGTCHIDEHCDSVRRALRVAGYGRAVVIVETGDREVRDTPPPKVSAVYLQIK